MKYKLNKKQILYGFGAIAGLFVCGITIILFLTFGNSVGFEEESKYIYVKYNFQTAEDKAEFLHSLDTSHIVKNIAWFNFIANKMQLWDNIKPGRYMVTQGMSVYKLIKKLRLGVQSPINFTLTKIRTLEALAGLCSKLFERDSFAFISVFLNDTFLFNRYQIKSHQFFSMLIPNTYKMFWNTSPKQFVKRVIEEYNLFWNVYRIQKAKLAGLSSQEIMVIASIVEEETNQDAEKPLVASVYINRLKKHIKLEADPTVKYCTKDFQLKRILWKHIDNFPCEYNTYIHYGLPPGVICTPNIKTIEAVLNYTPTDYLFFCARPERDGFHNFATTLKEHRKNASLFHRMLNKNRIY